jgi:hypothetical protein
MSKAHKGRETVYVYLAHNFPWKESLVLDGEVYVYEEVLEAISKLKRNDPLSHKILAYRWLTTRTRADISAGLFMDSSTLKRMWDYAIDILVNYLRHKHNREGNIAPLLEPIDLIYKIKS